MLGGINGSHCTATVTFTTVQQSLSLPDWSLKMPQASSIFVITSSGKSSHGTGSSVTPSHSTGFATQLSPNSTASSICWIENGGFMPQFDSDRTYNLHIFTINYLDIDQSWDIIVLVSPFVLFIQH